MPAPVLMSILWRAVLIQSTLRTRYNNVSWWYFGLAPGSILQSWLTTYFTSKYSVLLVPKYVPWLVAALEKVSRNWCRLLLLLLRSLSIWNKCGMVMHPNTLHILSIFISFVSAPILLPFLIYHLVHQGIYICNDGHGCCVCGPKVRECVMHARIYGLRNECTEEPHQVLHFMMMLIRKLRKHFARAANPLQTQA